MASKPSSTKRGQPKKLGRSPLTGHYVLKPVGKRGSGSSRTLSARPDKKPENRPCP